jgi:predicted DNA-binding transcriptional regulator AlpA
MAKRIWQKETEIDRLLTIEDVKKIIPYSNASLYRMISEGEFPAPLKLGGSRSAWRSSEIRAWIDSRPIGVTEMVHPKKRKRQAAS